MVSKEQLKKLRDKNIVTAKAACKAAVQKEHCIIAAIETIKTMEQTINRLARRCRSWYALYDPETEYTTEEHEALLSTILSNKKRSSTMGADLSKADQEPIKHLAKQIINLYEEQQKLETYIAETLQSLAPNTAAIAEPKITAKLFVHSGSLKGLAMMPASAIQLLGAEEAFFRFKQDRGRCPKHGLIINHPLVTAARKQDRGKIARTLAAAISKTAKVDYFGGDEYYGYKLREALEKKCQEIKKRKIKVREKPKELSRREKLQAARDKVKKEKKNRVAREYGDQRQLNTRKRRT
jgi:nucleolar protein 56